MYKCLICNSNFDTIKKLSNHLRFKEKIQVKKYYDAYLKKPNEGICVCGKPTKFSCLEEGYKHHCSYKCSNSDKEVQKKQQETTLKHYDVLHPAQSSIVMDRMHETCNKLYNASNGHGENQKEAMKQKNLEKYGVEYSWQREDVKQKINQTRLEKYGDETFTNRQKCKETMLSKYGVINCSQLDNWKEKVENTKLSKYGDKHYNNATKMSITKQYKSNKYEIDNNCTSVQHLIKQYGAGFRSSPLYKKVMFIYKDKAYINNEYIPELLAYNNYTGNSKYEKQLEDFIKSFYFDTVLKQSRKIISPQELDIYLPDLKLAIEFNGTYWHSYPNKSKNYHLNKSIECRNKGIRLIHIYEFENFEEQKRLLKDLIEGRDNYPLGDFNKNNLIEDIPKPCIIYKKDYTIYGAGKLY